MTQQRLVPAVGYVCMSSDQQTDSPERQKADIRRYAKRNGYTVSTWYEDHGLTGTESANRPSFIRMLADSQAGKLKVILLSEQSRMSREGIFDAMMHWRILQQAGVKIITCQRGELDFSHLGGIITAIVDQYSAHDESLKISERTVSGKLLKAQNGQRIGGLRLFGYDGR